MECYTFFKINNFYLLLADTLDLNLSTTDEKEFSELLDTENIIIEYDKIKHIPNESELFGDDLESLFEKKIRFRRSRYFILRSDSERVFIVAEFTKTSFLHRNKQLQHIKETFLKAKNIVSEFRRHKRDILLKKVLGNKNGIQNCIAAMRDYVFHDEYSLWFYNDYTKFFTCVASSFKPEITFLKNTDDHDLWDFLNSAKTVEHRTVVPASVNAESLKQMQTLNRFRVDVGEDGAQAVLTLYSRHQHFEITGRANKYIKNLLSLKYLAIYQEAQKNLALVENDISDEYKPGRVYDFLEVLTRSICKHLSFEACSFLLFDPDSNSLTLAATNDVKTSELPKEPVVYELKNVCLTTKAYLEGKFFSYNLQEDILNSGRYNEVTELESFNWVGLCIIQGKEKLGVLRVKNSYQLDENGIKEARLIRPADIANLMHIADRVANVIVLDKKYDYLLEISEIFEKKLEEIEDFNKIFLHEIRTPMSSFNFTPEILSKEIAKLKLEGDDKKRIDKIREKINDIKVLGERLKFISGLYYFDKMFEKGEVEELRVLHDVIYPVYNIAIFYTRKMYNINIEFANKSALENVGIIGNKTKLNMAFNILIDNASKYNKDTSSIKIFGKYDPSMEFFNVTIENNGLEISADEKDTIFHKGIRGGAAQTINLAGTGIGLYLAKKIMDDQSGDLVLISFADPVSFCLKIPCTEV